MKNIDKKHRLRQKKKKKQKINKSKKTVFYISRQNVVMGNSQKKKSRQWFMYESLALQNNQTYFIHVSVPIRCSELVERIAATCAKVHNARLHRWQIDGNLC